MAAIVLVSGGMDSCVTAAVANREDEIRGVLHINYGQRTEQRELQAFQDIAGYYNADNRLVLDLSVFREIGGSSLTDPAIPVSRANLESTEIPTSYVPFRNANFLSAAVGWAEVLGVNNIYIGAVEEDSSGYPDCRREFYQAFNAMVDVGTKPDTHIEIVMPLISLKKHEIIRLGLELNAPLDKSWSCYQREDLACGECDSCALRLRGFQEAGVEDPIAYAQ
jgi:7-cyano-7-deazaguanine synthase